jgi:hypothetical protein
MVVKRLWSRSRCGKERKIKREEVNERDKGASILC